MEIRCPRCDSPLSASDTNVAKDTAVCPRCDEAFAISELVADRRKFAAEFDLGQPPRGVTFEKGGAGWRLTSTTRSPVALFLVPFAIFMGGVGFPSLYAYIESGKYDWNQTVGVSLFCLGTLVLFYFVLLTTIGRLAVSVERGEGNVAVGVGPLRWTRRFDWNSIRKVEEENVAYGDNRLAIVLIGQQRLCRHRLKFGSMLTDQRRRFLVQALRELLEMRDE